MSDHVTRAEAEAQIAAAMQEGERRGRQRGKRDGLQLALERVEGLIVSYGDNADARAALLTTRRELADLLARHPGEERGGTEW